MAYEWIIQNYPEPNLLAENIKDGVEIFGVNGNYSWWQPIPAGNPLWMFDPARPTADYDNDWRFDYETWQTIYFDSWTHIFIISSWLRSWSSNNGHKESTQWLLWTINKSNWNVNLYKTHQLSRALEYTGGRASCYNWTRESATALYYICHNLWVSWWTWNPKRRTNTWRITINKTNWSMSIETFYDTDNTVDPANNKYAPIWSTPYTNPTWLSDLLWHNIAYAANDIHVNIQYLWV